jgi:hypothetical protein
VIELLPPFPPAVPEVELLHSASVEAALTTMVKASPDDTATLLAYAKAPPPPPAKLTIVWAELKAPLSPAPTHTAEMDETPAATVATQVEV